MNPIGPGPKDENELMIDPDGLHAVEQFVLAKYYLTTNVYRHRVRLITDQMIVRAIMLGIEEDEIKELARLYAFNAPPAFVANYLQWDDARFMIEFLCAAAHACATDFKSPRGRPHAGDHLRHRVPQAVSRSMD